MHNSALDRNQHAATVESELSAIYERVILVKTELAEAHPAVEQQKLN